MTERTGNENTQINYTLHKAQAITVHICMDSNLEDPEECNAVQRNCDE